MSQAPVKKKHKNKRKRESGGNGILQETPGKIENMGKITTEVVCLCGLLKCFSSKNKGKDQESIQSSTTTDPGYQWETSQLHN